MRTEEANAYHERHKPQALLVWQDGRIALERYDSGFTRDDAHALYSGTKSFWGVAALCAQSEGVLDLDERVWHGASIRQLLNLTAGAPFGGLGSAVPTYEKALATPPKDAPGSTFTYSGIPLQIFGAVFARKLAPLAMTPHAYLHARVLDPHGIATASWRTLKDGTHPLPTGAFLTALNWLLYGEHVLANAHTLRECFTGSAANPRYGLGWWLAFDRGPRDLVYASGSGGQALYVVPSQRTIVVRFGQGGSFNHEAFLKRLYAA